MNAQRNRQYPTTWIRATSLTPEAQQTLERRRQRTGVLLGIALGCGYGLVSQFINRLALPGIPLYQPPLGPLGNAALNTLVGAGLGFLTTRPNSAALGIFAGSLAGAVAIMVDALLRLGDISAAPVILVAGLVFSAPIAWLTMPMIALLRWVAERQVDALRDGASLLARLRTPVVLVLVMGLLAGFELLPGAAREQLVRTHALLQTGLTRAADGAADLPAPLRGPRMGAFPPAGGRGYTLEWTMYDLDRFIELRPSSTYDQHTAVIARFDGGGAVVCLYPTPRSEPNCGSY